MKLTDELNQVYYFLTLQSSIKVFKLLYILVNKLISKLKYDDDEPLYDHVASDDDYATPDQISAMVILFIYIYINLYLNIFIFKMAKHSELAMNPNDTDDCNETEKYVIEETVDSSKLIINHVVPELTLYNENEFKSKLLDSEAKMSKLTSEIDLLKKKVGCIFPLTIKNKNIIFKN